MPGAGQFRVFLPDVLPADTVEIDHLAVGVVDHGEHAHHVTIHRGAGRRAAK